MLGGLHLFRCAAIAAGQARQAGFIVLVVRRLLVAGFAVQHQESRRDHHLAGGAQAVAAIIIIEIDAGALQPGAGHLAGDGAVPDQRIEFLRIRIRPARPAREIRRADGFVRLLGVLGLGGIEPRLFGQHIGLGSIILRDQIAHGGHGFAGNLHAIGAHVGDAAIFIQALRDAHRVAGVEAQPARSLLLQGRCGERRRGVAADWLGLHRPHRKSIVCNGFPRSICCSMIQIELAEFLAIQHRQPRHEGRAIGRDHLRRHAPIFARDMRLDLAFALHHQPQRHRLHAARALRAGQLAPQHRGEREADQIIQRPARQIGIDQWLIEIARGLHGARHRRLGDFIERHPPRAALGHRPLVLQPFQQVPGNRLALAIRIGRQDHAVGALGRLANR